MADRRVSKFVNFKSIISLCFLFLLRNCLTVFAKNDSVVECNTIDVIRLTGCTDTNGDNSSLNSLRNNVTRPKFFKSRIPYCWQGMLYIPNPRQVTPALFSVDVQTNQGPVKNLCSICGKSASSNHRKLICSGCKLWCHIGPRCGNISQHQYTQFQSQVSYIWYCPKCIHQDDHIIEHFDGEINNSSIDTDMFEELRNAIGSKGRGLCIAHLNVRGLLSKFNEIVLLIKESNMDILVITESHLDRKVPDEQIVIDGYDLKCCGRNKHGGGVLVYFNSSLDITPFKKLID